MANKMSSNPSFVKIKDCLVSKDGKNKKLDTFELAKFCEFQQCQWLRMVNFGNGVKIPHCVLRGNEVRPHGRCKHINAFVEFAKISLDEVEIDKTPIEDEEEEQ